MAWSIVPSVESPSSKATSVPDMERCETPTSAADVSAMMEPELLDADKLEAMDTETWTGEGSEMVVLDRSSIPQAPSSGFRKPPLSFSSPPRSGRPYKGVRQRKFGRHICEIRDAGGKRIWLGSYSTQEEAARVYDMAARILQGEGAWLNFPEDEPQPVTLPRATVRLLLLHRRQAMKRKPLPLLRNQNQSMVRTQSITDSAQQTEKVIFIPTTSSTHKNSVWAIPLDEPETNSWVPIETRSTVDDDLTMAHHQHFNGTLSVPQPRQLSLISEGSGDLSEAEALDFEFLDNHSSQGWTEYLDEIASLAQPGTFREASILEQLAATLPPSDTMSLTGSSQEGSSSEGSDAGMCFENVWASSSCLWDHGDLGRVELTCSPYV